MSARRPLELIPALHRATHSVSVYLERHSGPAITQAEAHILSHLWTGGECTVAELHRAFGHRRSTLTSILDRLADRRLILREVSPSDRRTFIVSLSPAGRKYARESYRILQQIEGALAGQLTPGQLQGFLATADAISGFDAAAKRRPVSRMLPGSDRE